MIDLTVGDWETAHIDVAPYDAGTAVTLTLHSPADTTPDGTPVSVDGGVVTTVDGVTFKRFTAAAVQYPAPGWWVRAWRVTGTGAAEPEDRLFVAPNPTVGGPDWTPTRERVAAYVPSRPLVPTSDGRNVDLMTFDATTRPTGAQVDQLIADAVKWVTDETGTLDATLNESATACAAIRAAAFIELGYPERNDPMRSTANNTSDRLFKQADAMLARLAARNEAITGIDPASPALLPIYSFPPAPLWGDQLLF